MRPRKKCDIDRDFTVQFDASKYGHMTVKSISITHYLHSLINVDVIIIGLTCIKSGFS